MKFSDILKRKSGAAGAAESALPPEESDEVIERRIRANTIQAMEVYGEAVSAARAIHAALNQPNVPAAGLTIPKEILLKTILALESGNQELLTLADRTAPDNYLHTHVVNVTILSVWLGLALKLPREEIYTLAAAAFVHDAGMVPFLPLALKPALLSESEIVQIRQHPKKSQEFLSAFTHLSDRARNIVHQAIGQIHERNGEGGYPDGAPLEAVHSHARIIGVADVYEALTHPRPWRARMIPHTALRVMIEEHEKSLDPAIVKVLIESLSLYPPGSFVKLSTGETGRVVLANQGLPTRPRVKLLLDRNGNRLPTPKTVNLVSQPVVYIVDAVDETQVQTKEPKLLLELRAQRWWVRDL